MEENEIERLVRTVFGGDWAAYYASLPDRETIETGDGRWYTRAR